MNFQDRIITIILEAHQAYKLEEAMDDFDKATLDAEDEARRTGKPIKLPKWGPKYGPTPEQMRGAEVIDTSTPEGKKRAAALEKSINKRKGKKKRKASRRGHPGQGRLPGMGR